MKLFQMPPLKGAEGVSGLPLFPRLHRGLKDVAATRL